MSIPPLPKPSPADTSPAAKSLDAEQRNRAKKKNVKKFSNLLRSKFSIISLEPQESSLEGRQQELSRLDRRKHPLSLWFFSIILILWGILHNGLFWHPFLPSDSWLCLIFALSINYQLLLLAFTENQLHRKLFLEDYHTLTHLKIRRILVIL